jgi:Flp pilus assembly protein TadG
MARKFLRDQAANAAVEFALVVPVLFTLILGIISTGALYFSQASMHDAAEWTARYWAVSDAGWTISSSCTFAAPTTATGTPTLPVGCTTADTPTFSTPQNYYISHYFGANLTGISYTKTTGVCTASGGSYGAPGVIFGVSGTYHFNAMFLNIPVSLQTQACYPIIE